MHFTGKLVFLYSSSHHVQTIIVNKCCWIHRLMGINSIDIQRIFIQIINFNLRYCIFQFMVDRIILTPYYKHLSSIIMRSMTSTLSKLPQTFRPSISSNIINKHFLRKKSASSRSNFISRYDIYLAILNERTRRTNSFR